MYVGRVLIMSFSYHFYQRLPLLSLLTYLVRNFVSSKSFRFGRVLRKFGVPRLLVWRS